jgi:hypothetical protein
MIDEKNDVSESELAKTTTSTSKTKEEINKDKADKLQAGLFLTLVTSLGVLSGFGYSFTTTKKKETKDLDLNKENLRSFYNLHDSGVQLARRALLRATLYSVSGFSLFCFSVWKLSGAKNFDEFRLKIGSLLPSIKRNQDAASQGRTEFKNLTELFQYIIDEDKKNKAKQTSANKNEK